MAAANNHQTATEDREALNDLVVNSDDLRALERQLGSFNLFRVLGLERAEIRHSNVLAWLLDPEESHGLRDAFLRRWLMRVLHETESEVAPGVDPVDVESLDLRKVEVWRERNYIDVLIRLVTTRGEEWVVAVENKVNAPQGEEQLAGYREWVQKTFPDAKHQLFIFLSQRDQDPEDDQWLRTDYDELHNALEQCVTELRGILGAEPRLVQESYLRLLKESFMEDTEIAALARKIYRNHQRAIDVIIKHMPDSIQVLTDGFEQHLLAEAAALGLKPMRIQKGIVRFIPTAWDIPANRLGLSWGREFPAYILCQIYLRGDRPVFTVVEGGSPQKWRDQLWEISKNLPAFKMRQKREKKPDKWMTVYSTDLDVDLSGFEGDKNDKLIKDIWNWCKTELQTDEFKAVSNKIAEHLGSLPHVKS